MRKNIVCFARCAVLFALCVSAEAQQPGNLPRIGFLSGRGEPTAPTVDPSFEAFRQGLIDLGYIEGKNILIETRYVEGKLDRVADIVDELVQLKVAALVSPVLAAIRSAKQTTKTVPIVMVITGDPVAAGLIHSLARPGANVTGVTRLTRDLSGKRLELLKEAVPKISRVGILWSTVPGFANTFETYQAAARQLKIPLHSLEVRGATPIWMARSEKRLKDASAH